MYNVMNASDSTCNNKLFLPGRAKRGDKRGLLICFTLLISYEQLINQVAIAVSLRNVESNAKTLLAFGTFEIVSNTFNPS